MQWTVYIKNVHVCLYTGIQNGNSNDELRHKNTQKRHEVFANEKLNHGQTMM